MQSGTGIQELMAAETRASQIVAEARIGGFTVANETTKGVIVKLCHLLIFQRLVCVSVRVSYLFM